MTGDLRVLILFNPVAGSGGSARLAAGLDVDLRRLAGEAGVPLEIERAETRAEPADLWLDARLRSVDLLVVVGGDGAVRLAAPAAIRCAVPIYHYPAGTENLFARDFGMRPDPGMLLDAIRGRRTRSIDVGRVEGELLLVCASMGLDAEVSKDLARNRGARISHLSYLRPILRQLGRWRSSRPSLEVEVDGATLGPADPGLVIVGNSRQYALRLDPARTADHADGLLDVIQLPARTISGLLLWLVRCRWGRQMRHRSARHARGRTIVVRSLLPAAVQIDGDPAFDGEERTRIEVVVEPAVLAVLLPAVREYKGIPGQAGN